jgi:hypothetical protein
MDDTSPREAAMKKVLEDHPDLASATDAKALSRLNELVDSYEREIITQRELEALRRKEFAEQARLQGEEARKQREDAARLAAEKEKAQRQAAELERTQRLEQERAQRLAEAGHLRRFAMTHPVLLGLGVLLVLGLVAGAVIATVQTSANNSARAAAEAEADRVAQEKAAQEEQDRQQAERQDQLEAACDPSLPESEITTQIWTSWLACEDPAVAEEAVRRVKSEPLDAATLERIAGGITNVAVAEFVATRPSTPLGAHELLVANWGPETVGPSYEVVYGQKCGPARPEHELAGSTWRSSDGALFTFTGRLDDIYDDLCLVEIQWPDEGWDAFWRQTGESLAIQVSDLGGSALLSYQLVGDELRLGRVSGDGLEPEASEVLTRVS